MSKTVTKAVSAKKPLPVSIAFDQVQLDGIDGEMWARKMRNRSAVIRMLVDEALHRAEVRRKKGLAVELAPGAKGAE